MKLLPVLFALSLLTATIARSNTDKDPLKLGVNYPDQSWNTWRSKLMSYPGKTAPSDLYSSGADFFTHEYGKACVFTSDLIKQYGYASGKYRVENGEFIFDSGKKGFSFAFGVNPKNKTGAPSPSLGAIWGSRRKDVYRLEMEITQNAPKTQWIFQVRQKTKFVLTKKFTVSGKQPQLFIADLGFVRSLNTTREGVKFTCTTPGVEVKIKSMKIAPYSADVYFRKQLELPFTPVMGTATFDAPEDYDVYINGKKAASGNYHYFPGTVQSVDLLPYLKKGKNTIAIRKSYLSWLQKAPVVMFEAFAAGRDGTVKRILGGTGWKTSLSAPNAWEQPGFDDSKWKNSKGLSRGINFVTQYRTHDNRNILMGTNPEHMGVLSTTTFDGRKYPIFESGEKQIAYTLKIPEGLHGKTTPKLSVVSADTDQQVESVTGVPGAAANGLQTYLFSIAGRASGAYRLDWTLKNAAGKIIDRKQEEMVIAGPIVQDEIALENFEQEFNKRLQLVQSIDCTAKATDDGSFVDHTGQYNKKPALNRGKVVERNGMKYRETGRGRWDWFAYKTKPLKIGETYLVEIVVPDDKARYVMSGLSQMFPVQFRNNPKGLAQWASTAACFTGDKYPLSGTKKTLRYICWPGSSVAAVVVMSGFAHYPAAACAINIYRVKGGLPALKVPESSRMLGTFNENIDVMIRSAGKVENSMFDTMTWKNGCINAWHSLYKAYERKIKWMRFQGRNMTGECVYQYCDGEYPSLKNTTCLSQQKIDRIRLAIKMYAANRIKCLLGFEYVVSPSLLCCDNFWVSDRKMHAGADSMYMVDKDGFQIKRPVPQGTNFLHPKIAKSLYDTLSEIYDFYQNAGPVAGLFMVTGKYWLPTFFPSITNGSLLDVGYGDLTVGMFEKETGINLGIDPKDPRRFSKRYKLLTEKYLQRWLDWRATKVRQMVDQVAKIITSGKNKWHLYVSPFFYVDYKNPFIEHSGTREQRSKFLDKCMIESGYPPAKYLNDKNVTLVTRMLRKYRFATPTENTDYLDAWNSESRKLVKNSKAEHFFDRGKPMFFDEVNTTGSASKNWLWKRSYRGIFVPQGIGDNAMEPFVNAVIDPIPELIMYSHLDYNMDTGHGSQIRRFCKSFYATPELNFKLLPPEQTHGVMAQTATDGDTTYLRLINNTPWPSTGSFKAGVSKVRDRVYDRNLDGGSDGNYAVKLKPYDIRVLTLSGSPGRISCNFTLPESVEKNILAKADFILRDREYRQSIPRNAVAAMAKALKAKDAFALYNLMNDFEVKNATSSIDLRKDAMQNQQQLLNDLKATGRIGIICGSTENYTAPDGSKWCKDQPCVGNAYGNEGATLLDRGKQLEIAGSNIARVYQTEAYGGRIFYRIPLPAGKYDVRLHFAETFARNKTPGARLISVTVENTRHPELVDPIKDAGGWGKPYVLEMKAVNVRDGKLDIELTGEACINGIEIIRGKG